MITNRMYKRSSESSGIAVGVYKTDVDDWSAAKAILDAVRRHLPGCDASFDLEDCDKMLRVESQNRPIDESVIRNIFKKHGHKIENLL